jgi:hypothetical protein
LIEILDRKKIPSKWREWVEQVVSGGRVGINLNGELGNYFRTFKGLRQGDTLSPLLFNLVAYGLATLLTKAREASLFRGLVPELIEGGLTPPQYANDIIIFLEADDEVIVNTKFLLYYFENMSGLRINYHKSEVMVVGATEEESATIANMLNCKVGSLHIKYLGIPVSNSKLFARDLLYVGLKVEKRLPA